MSYFSDRELGSKPAIHNEISVNVWNGIVAVIESFMANNHFSKNFPERCPEGGIYNFNKNLFRDKLKSIIPNLYFPFQTREEFETHSEVLEDLTIHKETVKTVINLHDTLDLIEFCYRNLNDVKRIGDLHTNHYHLEFKEGLVSKDYFRTEINSLFERNGVAYKLDSYGKINRIISSEFIPMVKRKFSTTDSELNKYLASATEGILLPKSNDRLNALKALWDAFERVKTFYDGSKRESVEFLLKKVSNNHEQFKNLLEKECKELTDIGNNFQIRHSETRTYPINDLLHIDYLFFRMLSLIDLFIKEVEK